MSVNEKMTAIADAIRAKTGGTKAMTLDQMAAEIAGIQAGTAAVLEEVTITENGEYTPDDEVDGFSKVTVDVESGGDYTNEQLCALMTGTISELSWPDGLTRIRDYTFYNCNALEVNEIPETVTYIGERAFGNASKVQISRIPDAAVGLGRYAFSFCPLITEVSIPAGVTMNQGTFYTCMGLGMVTFRGIPAKLDTMTFNNCPNLTTINVPWAEGEVASAPWGATNATINYNHVEG